MKRNARFLKNNDCYFVTNRARKNQKIFLHMMDYRYYFRLLRKYKSKLSMSIFAFCLLPEEIHLIIQPQCQDKLPLFIHEISQSYLLYFNSRYQHQGKILHDRYKSTVIRNDVGLSEYIKFVEFIPVKFQIADTPVCYPWSSCSYRVLRDGDGLLDRRPYPDTFFERK